MTQSRRTTPHLFEQWDRIAKRIRGSSHLAVFLDFDGTLVQRLAKRKEVTLALISERRSCSTTSLCRGWSSWA